MFAPLAITTSRSNRAPQREFSYLHDDAVGTTRFVSDDQRQVTELDYDAFGHRRNPDWSDPSVPINTTGVTLGFTGQESDDEHGLIHMGVRMYDPAARQFTSPDATVQRPAAGGLNRYAYVFSNPMHWVDPTGYYAEAPLAALPTTPTDAAGTESDGGSAHSCYACGLQGDDWLTADSETTGQQLSGWGGSLGSSASGGPTAGLNLGNYSNQLAGSFAKGLVAGGLTGAAMALGLAAAGSAAPFIASGLALGAGYELYQNWDATVAFGGRVISGTLTPDDALTLGFGLGGLAGGAAGGWAAGSLSTAAGAEMAAGAGALRPLVYGPSAGGRLAATAESLGGETLNDLASRQSCYGRPLASRHSSGSGVGAASHL
jgi:RHS repeat-associated protein